MTTQIQRRRGTTAQHSTFTGAVGEVTVDTDKEVLVVHDGAQVGGYPQMRENGSNSALALGSAGTPSLKFTGDTNTGIYSPGADQIAITTGGTSRLFIDSSGRLLAGTSTARANFFGTTLSSLAQIEGTGGSTARGSLSVLNNDVSNNPPYVLLGRSGAATLGSNAAVVSGSRLGTLTFHGADGTSFIEAATVAGEVDGTPGTNDMPGRLVFSTTADGAASPTERLRITSAGLVGIGTSSPAKKLDVYEGSAGNVEQYLRNTTINLLSKIDGTTSAQFGTETSHPLLLLTGNSERARLDTSGEWLVYSSGNDTLVAGNAAGSGTAQSLFTGVHTRTSTTGGGTVAYRIYNNGTTFSVSDARQKKNVETARDGYLEDLQQLRVVKYNWIDQADTESKELGLLAQEVAQVFPGLVQSADPSDPESTLGIKSSVFSFMLIKALQEAGEKIEALETRLAALEAQ